MQDMARFWDKTVAMQFYLKLLNDNKLWLYIPLILWANNIDIKVLPAASKTYHFEILVFFMPAIVRIDL